MQLRQIEVFHAYMITGSTVAAADMLSVTQPAISTTLKRMQDELNLKLFRSVKGRLQPTAEAHMLFRQVRAIQEDINQLSQLSKALAEGKTGNIRVGVVPALGENIAAQAIADVTRGSADLKVSIEVLNSHELMHLVQAGRLDFACIFGKAHDLPVETIFETSIQVNCVLPSGYLDGSDSITLDEYVQLPLSLMRPTDPIGRLILEACSARNLHPNSTIELRNCKAAIAFAEKGVAVGLADDITLSGTTLAHSKAVPFDPPLNVELTIVRKAGHQSSIAEDKLVKAFEAML